MTTQNSREELSELVTSLPLVQLPNTAPIINETDSLAMIYDLEQSGSTLPDRLKTLKDVVNAEVLADLGDSLSEDGHYVLTERELLGALTKALRRGATQTLADSGQVAMQLQGFYYDMGMQSPGTITSTD